MFDLTKTLKVLPVHIIDAHMKKEVALRMGEELESLIHTLGATIVDRVMQKLDRPETATFIGKGKIQEIAQLIEQKKIDLVILSRMAKPRQIHQLKKTFLEANPKIEVWDRVDLILHIFDKHAKTVEARLQIEMARMEYMGPRIYGMGFELSQQGGGIGVRGIGETNTERMKRHWRSEIKRVEDQLTKLTQNRQSQIAFRKRNGLKTVSIVGYTNAGKSSLFNKLTHKESYVADVLFATLETTVGKLYISKLHKEVLATDTIATETYQSIQVYLTRIYPCRHFVACSRYFRCRMGSENVDCK